MNRTETNFRNHKSVYGILALFVLCIFSIPAFADDMEIENKSTQFSSSLSKANSTSTSNNNTLAEMIRRQREQLDNASNSELVKSRNQSGGSSCDTALRKCMVEKCGTGFIDCTADGDTEWGGKLDSCRRKTKCSGHEFDVFSTEIKADRDATQQMGMYQKIIDCGLNYNSCIEQQCGSNFNKCLGKKAGDDAIRKCSNIATQCKQQDSGLASRTMEIFSILRQGAEIQIQADEKSLYSMRDEMRSACQSLGHKAMFDERSFDCVISVEFWAGTGNTPSASKKLYAGNTFDCTPEWFGIDVTTFKENAARETRSQTAASSAMMGAGAGIAAGAISSGAINRAIDTKKAKNELKKAKKEEKKAEKAEKQLEGGNEDKPGKGKLIQKIKEKRCANGKGKNCPEGPTTDTANTNSQEQTPQMEFNETQTATESADAARYVEDMTERVDFDFDIPTTPAGGGGGGRIANPARVC